MIYINLLLILLVIIFIHELGHYTIARLFKTTVTDFSIGFGKVLYKFTDKNLTNWKFSIIPLGGYVKIKGLESIFNNSKNIENSADSFAKLNLFKKIMILLAGSFFNILSAWICLFFILFFSGIVIFQPIIGNIVDNSPASKSDLLTGDQIVNIDDIKINSFNDIPNAIKNKKFIKMKILRKNEIIQKDLFLEINKETGKYYIGISSNNNPKILYYNLFLSLKNSTLFIPTYYFEIFNYIFKSYNNNNLSKDLAGPIGMVKMADKLMLDRILGVLSIFISISLFVAIFNLVPIPLLDGGHIIYFIVRKIFSDSLPSFVTKVYLMTGLTIIGLIFILITFNDIFYK